MHINSEASGSFMSTWPRREQDSHQALKYHPWTKKRLLLNTAEVSEAEVSEAFSKIGFIPRSRSGFLSSEAGRPVPIGYRGLQDAGWLL